MQKLRSRLRRKISQALGLPWDHTTIVNTKHGPIKLYGVGDTCAWRAETFHTKEPETLEWIDGFEKGDVFWDIGANIGLYSLYAAKRGCKVVAFEPVAANLHFLNCNIWINELDIVAYPIVVGDTTGMRPMGVSGKIGDTNGLDHPGLFQQGAIYNRLDWILANLFQVPQHIKIDVDGAEESILRGGHNLLANPKLKSIQIEGRKPYDIKGWKLVSSKQSRLFDGTEHAGILNHQYVRDPAISSSAAGQ